MQCKKTCPVCMKNFTANAPGTVYCSSECREKATPVQRNKNQKVFPQKICPICNKVFEASSNHRKYCNGCQKEGRTRVQLEYQRNRKMMERYSTKRKKRYEIEEINRKALAEHLSYGKYVAKYGL